MIIPRHSNYPIGVAVYGHFKGCEPTPDPNLRNLADANYASIIIGDIDSDDYYDIDTLVTASDGIFDGFTVTKANNYGMYCKDTSTTISNCIFENTNVGIVSENSDINVINSFITTNNINEGIFCFYSDVVVERCTIIGCSTGLYASNNSNTTVTDCIIGGNTVLGAYITGSSAAFQNCDVNDNWGNGIEFLTQTGTIERCKVYRNMQYGIVAGRECNIVNNVINNNYSAGVCTAYNQSNITLANNIIHNNQTNGIEAYGSIEIRNNTIVSNSYYGVSSPADPTINSNIIYDNSTGQFNNTFTNVNYNCIENYTGGGTGNTSTNPQLDAEYCLTSASTSCIDNGNPNFQTSDERDITGEFRCLNAARSTLNAVVDKGADEYNPYDLNFDSKINFMDFTELADDWQTVYDIFDVRNMCAYWLMGTDWPGVGGKGAEFAEVLYECPSQMMSVSPQLYVGGSLASIYSMRSISAEPEMAAESIPEPVDVNSLLNWLDDVWKNDEAIRESMTESEYLEFRNAIENIE